MAGPTDPLEHGSVDPLGSLTDRQREVLDMVLEHKTSKEIARELGIGPKTVDRHIDAAREKLGVADRNAAAGLAAGLRERGQNPPAGALPPIDEPVEGGGNPAGAFSPLSAEPAVNDPMPQENVGRPLSELLPASKDKPGTSSEDPPLVLPRMFHGPNGQLTRLAAIVGLAIGMLMALLVGLSVADALTDLIRDP